MSRANKKALQLFLDEWSKLRSKVQRIESEREQKLQPLREKFEKESAPITAEATRKLQPIQEQISEIENQITTAMKSGIGADGEIAIPYISNDTATAEVVSNTQREIEPEMFFQETPASKRTAAFWACVKIQIGKAEKFLGSRIDELAELKRTYTVKIRLK